MELDLFDLAHKNVTLLLFLVIGIGYLIGNLKIGGISAGNTTGVLLAGMLFGHFGFPDIPGAATFGFSLFIFSVGLQAGPRFFSAFLQDGPKYIALSVFVAAFSVALALTFSRWLNFDYGMTAGMLAGSLTSTPTLAGAQDAIVSGLVNLPEGMSAETAASNISIAYAITYIFGTVGMIVFIRYFPKMIRLDLPQSAKNLAKERGLASGNGRKRSRMDKLPIIRAYQAKNSAVGKTLAQLKQDAMISGKILQVRRGKKLFEPTPDFVVEEGDIASIIASLEDHQRLQTERKNREVLDAELLDYNIKTYELVAINPAVVGKPFGQLEITDRYGCFISGITRAAIDLPYDDNLLINKGDRLHVTGEEDRIRILAGQVGHIDAEVEETDLMTFSFGIVLGIVLGVILVKVGNLSIGLGGAGGLLLAGILIGYLRSVHPTFGRLPAAARYLLMELGLMMFMASVGLKAGGGMGDALTSVGPSLFLCGVVLTLSPVMAGYLFGRKVLKMNPALLLGSITGAMTSTPSLSVVNEAAKSQLPGLGYAGTYTFANVLLTFAGTFLMTL
jgi:putative transport protein